MEARKVRQVGHIGHQALDRAWNVLRAFDTMLQTWSISRAISASTRIEMSHVAAGVVDIGLEQDRVARSLVDLDVEKFDKMRLNCVQ